MDDMSKLALLGNKEQSKQFDIGDRLMIGRNPDNDIRLNNVTVSRYHATLVSTMGNTYVEDLNSKNGTLIISKRIEKHRMWEDSAWQAYNEINVDTKHVKKCLLKDGDIIKICNYKSLNWRPQFSAIFTGTSNARTKP